MPPSARRAKHTPCRPARPAVRALGVGGGRPWRGAGRRHRRARERGVIGGGGGWSYICPFRKRQTITHMVICRKVTKFESAIRHCIIVDISNTATAPRTRRGAWLFLRGRGLERLTMCHRPALGRAGKGNLVHCHLDSVTLVQTLKGCLFILNQRRLATKKARTCNLYFASMGRYSHE
jgi:hypothetical protein